MSEKAAAIKSLIEAELSELGRDDVALKIRELLVEPEEVIREWNYGDPGQSYMTWTILKHPPSNTGIAYCEQGFGPRRPWGLVWLVGDAVRMSLGMDSSWYPTFVAAYVESMAAADLPIWRVYQTDAAGHCFAISAERSFDEAWAMIEALRRDQSESRFDCRCDIPGLYE